MQDLEKHQDASPTPKIAARFAANAAKAGAVESPPVLKAVKSKEVPPPAPKDDFPGPDYAATPKDRRAPLLRMLMLISVLIIAALAPVSGFLGLLSLGDIICIGIILVGLGLGLGALALKRVQTAGYLFILIGLLALVVRCLLAYGSLSELAFNYFIVVTAVALAGLVINEVAPLIVAAMSIVGFGLVFWQYGVNSRAEAGDLVRYFLMGTAVHLLITVIVWANAHSMLRAVRQLAWQNDRLLQANRGLEKNISLRSNVGDSIGQLAAELFNISHEQSDRAHSQAQSVVIVTSTLEELSATARQVAEVADNVYSATAQALHTAETGGKAVGFGIDSIATLTDQIETISTIANELGRQSRRISEIVETITELAEETNLLALNATIEAAGAGEYGRRFAVVAQEVQFLATRSRAASRDVQHILGQIRTSINNTLKATNEGLNEAQRMSEVASQAGEALEQIIENVEGTTYLARQINLTTQQQRTATDQAVEMVRQVADNSRDATARSRQLLLASDRLNQTAAHLRLDPPDTGLAKAET